MKIKGLILLLSVLLGYQAHSQSPWKIDKNKHGIIIYTRIENDSHFKSFKATVTVNASTDAVINILKDSDNYSKWYGYTETSRLIKQEKDIQFNYVETKFPWPYQNRDMVYRMSISKLDTVTTKISLKGLPNYIPKTPGIARMQKAEGYILLKALRNNQTEIVYIFHSEPGDNIPAWLANNSIAELPFKTLSGLREILKKENKVSR